MRNYLIWLREMRAEHFVVILSLLFLAMAVIIHAQNNLYIDVEITNTLQRIRNPFFDGIMTSITFLGNSEILFMASLASALGFVSKRRVWPALFAALTFTSIPINVGLKALVARIRPTSDLVDVVVHAGGYSFPSGHVMGSVVVYGFIAFLLWTHLPSGRPRLWIVGSLLALVVLISISRVYLGVHWFSDVLGAWLAGLVMVLIMIEIYHRLVPLQEKKNLN